MTTHLELRMGTLVSLLLLSVGPTAHPSVKCVPTEPIYAEAPLDRNAGALKGKFYVNPNRTIWALAVGNLVAHKAYKIPVATRWPDTYSHGQALGWSWSEAQG
jgi:hypothetical protein